MRIALISQEYPPETAKGGIGSQAYMKAHGLASRGHQVQVISRSLTGKRAVIEDGPVRVLRVPGPEHRSPVHTEVADWLGYSGEVAAALAELHRVTPFDLAEFPEWAAEGYVHLLNRTPWNYLRTVIHLHGPLVMLAHTIGWPEVASEFYRTGTAMEGTCLRLADAVFSSSRCSAEWVCLHYGLNRDSIPVLHTGVDTELFTPRAIPKETRPTLLYVGKLARNKGVLALIQAALDLLPHFPDLQVRLAGQGDALREIEAMAKQGPPGFLDLRGFVARDRLAEEFSRAHIFAAPSLQEGGPGFVCLEAMACGLPVVACSGSGAAEALGGCGVLVPPGDHQALVEALHALLLNPTKRQELGAEAIRFVREQHGSRRCLDELESYYTAIAAGKPWRAAA